mmetsp:Transcript_19202/g.67780  ORF Transcript_19202/g.67780 Transcript_19202/m.67780 type:complete len:297 (-) Transcript_19202:145-1035(-)
MRRVNSDSSRWLVTRGAILSANVPPRFSISVLTASIAPDSADTPASFVIDCVSSTYSGGAMSLICIGMCSVECSMPLSSAARMASMPSPWKHVSCTSARSLIACGVRRRRMFFNVSSHKSRATPTSSGPSPPPSPAPSAFAPPSPPSDLYTASGSAIAVLNASNACLNLAYSGQPIILYMSSSGICRLSDTWRRMECTCFALANFSSHAATSSGATRRFDRSMYPFSLSTRITITTSFFPTRTSLLMERMRRRDSSDSMIMPSMLLYSSSVTYAPISAIDLTFTITSSSTSGNFFS